ncbi:zinc finger E-box-binding homeobox protein zag-1-like isoform X17 [Ylistrum balloti]|uniref:zinc finger E-box-binding homeobox protein zag-1-like isoform X17 n=1 Tax=Ylistrum balloti TaxID=509963 RepID=UPI002905AEEE|nr:zinc finger E-box-binding homeobox protein zag-1-like isoform X17 [Ylistrum balloti]XP_060086427.1 zinc finger E-box-binding homeobox protein zag-1-like isoform X17 [Ylistrum balloti]
MNYQKVYMNQIHSSSLLCQLSAMWKNQLLCDAIIKTGQIITKAHRVVLVAACPMLQSMENAAAGSHLEVRLAADIKQESVNTFLQYLYEGFMMLTEDNVRDVEKVARLLQVDSVIKCVADFYKCMHAKTGIAFPGTQYKYNFNDLIEFRHVRVTDLQKTVHDGAAKRMSDFPRPGSPGSKRPRLNRGASPSDGTVIGSDKADDTASMSHSYMAGAPDPWDRVPKLGSGMGRQGATGKNSQPGVIEIVEESIELVQTEPPEKDSGQPSSSRSSQKTSSSISIAIASQYNTDPDLSIVTVPEKPSSATQPPGPISSSSTPQQGSITVSPLTVFQDSQHAQSSPSSSSSSRDLPGLASSSTTDRQTSFRQEQPFSGFSQKQDSENVFSSSKQHQQQPRTSDSQMTSTPQRTPFPVSITPSASQGKPFAAGSAMQAMVTSSPISVSQSSPAPSRPRPTPQPAMSMSVPDSSSLSMDVGPGGDDGKGKSTKIEIADSMQESTADLTPDLSIVKVEAALGDGETGGLDMHVDMAEQSIMQMQAGASHQEEFEEPSDAEIEEWAREEMSNEGANMSGDPNSSWYMGSYKGNDVPQDASTMMLQCSDCGAYCSSAEEYQKHHKTHRVNRFVCDICHKGFQYDSFLKVHMHSHLVTRPYGCKACGKTYKWQHHLKTHKCIMQGDLSGTTSTQESPQTPIPPSQTSPVVISSQISNAVPPHSLQSMVQHQTSASIHPSQTFSSPPQISWARPR